MDSSHTRRTRGENGDNERHSHHGKEIVEVYILRQANEARRTHELTASRIRKSESKYRTKRMQPSEMRMFSKYR